MSRSQMMIDLLRSCDRVIPPCPNDFSHCRSRGIHLASRSATANMSTKVEKVLDTYFIWPNSDNLAYNISIRSRRNREFYRGRCGVSLAHEQGTTLHWYQCRLYTTWWRQRFEVQENVKVDEGRACESCEQSRTQSTRKSTKRRTCKVPWLHRYFERVPENEASVDPSKLLFGFSYRCGVPSTDQVTHVSNMHGQYYASRFRMGRSAASCILPSTAMYFAGNALPHLTLIKPRSLHIFWQPLDDNKSIRESENVFLHTSIRGSIETNKGQKGLLRESSKGREPIF